MRRTVLLLTLTVALAAAAGARGEIVFRCDSNLCGANSDGSAKHALTTFGTADAPLVSPSATADGSALAFIQSNTAYVVTFPAKQVTDLKVNTADVVRIRADGTKVAVINEQQEAFGSLVPWLVTVNPDGSGYENDSRYALTTGWLGAKLLRDGYSATAHDCAAGSSSTNCPAQSICLVAADGTCGANVADDPQRNLYDPSASPDGALIAATATPYKNPADATAGRGDIALYDATTGAPVRDLTSGGADGHPAFSPDGKLVAFDRSDGGVYVVGVAGGTPRKVADGDSPTWLGPDAAKARCKVPRLVGLGLRIAKRTLVLSNCRIGKVTKRHASRSRRGKVIAQSPKPGASRPAGAAVAVTVGR